MSISKDITDKVTEEFPSMTLGFKSVLHRTDCMIIDDPLNAESDSAMMDSIEQAAAANDNSPASFGDLSLMQLIHLRKEFDEDVGRVEFIAWDYCVARFPGDSIALITNVEDIEYE